MTRTLEVRVMCSVRGDECVHILSCNKGGEAGVRPSLICFQHLRGWVLSRVVSQSLWSICLQCQGHLFFAVDSVILAELLGVLVMALDTARDETFGTLYFLCGSQSTNVWNLSG